MADVVGPRGGVLTIGDAAYTVKASDNNLKLCFTSASAVTVTVPVGLPIGWSATIVQAGAGTVTVSPGTSVTVNNLLSNYSTAGQWSELDILSYLQDSFVIYGGAGGSVGPTSYQYAAPLTGATVVMAVGITRLLLNPAGTLATLTVDLPASPIDGQVAEIMTSQQLTALTIATTDSSTVNGVSGFAFGANTGASWLYRASGTTWYVRY